MTDVCHDVFIVALRSRLSMYESSSEALPVSLAILRWKGILQDLLNVFENLLSDIPDTLIQIHPVWVQFRRLLRLLFLLNYALSLNIRHFVLVGADRFSSHRISRWLYSWVQVLLLDVWRAGSALILSSRRCRSLLFDGLLLLLIQAFRKLLALSPDSFDFHVHIVFASWGLAVH